MNEKEIAQAQLAILNAKEIIIDKRYLLEKDSIAKTRIELEKKVI